ncbi:Transcriptional regulatory protein RXT2 [Lachnellula suecica]|uniref:Transcriptional regulatory protein RXT2 n=1 Tax=Lachnellula suecica TaxID=602035 RepID=A0A8T9C2E5_9HELO|nr:Transcriptional regulatory protein RXT2 [Lachnellula suecica]
MASQAAQIADTIAGMKKAAKRKAYGKTPFRDFDSDSDSSIEQLTNRGNKLRKKSKFVHEGQLAPPTGPQAYKKVRAERIEHAGFYRNIISRNPPLIDDDGYEVDSDDDDERAQAAMAAAADIDPYSEVKIENLLMPLTAASDLPNHPTLSKPFTSKTLTNLTEHAAEMVQKERASLWRIKHLLTRLSGDSTWIPCESVETENDLGLFFEERERHRDIVLGKNLAKDADQASTGTLISDDNEQRAGLLTADAQSLGSAVEAVKQITQQAAEDEDVTMASMDSPAENGNTVEDETSASIEMLKKAVGGEENGTGILEKGKAPEVVTDGHLEEDGAAKDSANNAEQPTEDVEMDGEGGAEDQDDLPAPRRMRTRAQAQAASENTASVRTRSASPDSNDEPYVHPYFLAPLSSRPDRDVGLPQQEAEETRRLLQLYIQKQEEVCRGAQKIYEGLMRANRLRNTVLKWAKAEGHVGVNRDMSDGEDWYDNEEWGLSEDLKKGHDEEEEDAATTAKKTRTRRQ